MKLDWFAGAFLTLWKVGASREELALATTPHVGLLIFRLLVWGFNEAYKRKR
jgi:hypothetical protein